MRYVRGSMLGVTIVSLAISAAFGQVRTDGSLGARQTLAGPDVLIPASLGLTRGGDLFPSVAQFDIPGGGSASFSGPSAVYHGPAPGKGGTGAQTNGPV